MTHIKDPFSRGASSSSSIEHTYTKETTQSQKKGLPTRDTIESMNQSATLETLKKDPKSMYACALESFESFKSYFTTGAPVVDDNMDIDTTLQVQRPRQSTQAWVENEMALIKSYLESGDISIDALVKHVTSLANLSSFQSAQEEQKETAALREHEKKLLAEQSNYYKDKKVFAAEALTTALGLTATIQGWGGADRGQQVFQLINGSGQAISKMGGNYVDGKKAAIQHIIEHMKQRREMTRSNHGSFESQSTKIHDQLLQALQARHQTIVELTRG